MEVGLEVGSVVGLRAVPSLLDPRTEWLAGLFGFHDVIVAELVMS